MAAFTRKPADVAACFNVPTYHRALWDEYQASTEEPAHVAQNGDERVSGFGSGFMPELYHRLFSEAPAEIAKREPAAAMRARLHELASELPEFETLRKLTTRDSTWSGMAATTLAGSVASALPERENTPNADRARELLAGLQALAGETGTSEALDAEMARVEGSARGQEYRVGEQAAAVDGSAVRNALRAAIEQATAEIQDAQDAARAFGCGSGFSASGGQSDPGVSVELARRVASSATLKRIVQLAGRLTGIARAKRATRAEYQRSEIVGVEQTGNIARVLPSEMSGLATELGTALLYRKTLEGTALGYKMSGRERTQKGPIVVCIDQSGSMSGDRDCWAKAVALALMDAAKSEGRAFGIVLYNGDVTERRLFPKPADVRPIEILEILSRECGGGTNYAPAIDQALSWIESSANGGTWKKADIIHITDGDARTVGVELARKRAHDVGATIYGILIGARESYALTQWSDSVASIQDVNQDTAAVNLVFDHV